VYDSLYGSTPTARFKPLRSRPDVGRHAARVDDQRERHPARRTTCAQGDGHGAEATLPQVSFPTERRTGASVAAQLSETGPLRATPATGTGDGDTQANAGRERAGAFGFEEVSPDSDARTTMP